MVEEHTEIKSNTRTRAWPLKALSSVWVVALAVAVFWMLIIWAIHWNSPRTLVSFHGMIHAAIAGQFLGSAHSSFPPENPFFAGQPLAYYWFFQFLAAQITRLFGLNIFYSLEIVIMIAMGTLMTTALFLGRRLYVSSLSGVLMGYLVVAGTNPLGWIQFVFRFIRRGPSILNDNPNHLWGVVHPIYSLIRYNDVGGLYGPLLNFFLNITSRPVALAAVLVVIFCLEWFLRSRSLLAFAGLCVACAAATAFSPIVGIPTGAALSLGLIAIWYWGRRKGNATDNKFNVSGRTMLYAVSAMVVGILIAAPTYYHLVIGPSDSQVSFWLFSIAAVRHLLMVGLSIFLLVILAVVGLIRAEPDRRMFLGLLFISAFILLALNVAFTLPASNQSNLFHAAVVLLAVPAAGSIIRAKSVGKIPIVSGRLATGIILVFLPTVLLLSASYIQRPTLAASFQSQNIARTPRDSDLGQLYEWVKNETAPQSVFILDPRERVTLCGNASEFPAMTNRVIFTEDPKHYIIAPYPDVRLRFEMTVRIVSGGEPNDSDRAYLASLSRPIYIVKDHAKDDTLISGMQATYGAPVFRAGTISVYHWLL